MAATVFIAVLVLCFPGADEPQCGQAIGREQHAALEECQRDAAVMAIIARLAGAVPTVVGCRELRVQERDA